MRKGTNSLIGVVHQQKGCDAKSRVIFIFIGSS